MIHKKMFRRYLSQGEDGARVLVTFPTGGSQFVVGEEYDITWTVNETVVAWRPYYSATGAAPWTAIIAEQAEDSPDTYAWTVPDDPSATSRVMIEVENEDSVASSGQSALFEIAATDTQAPSGTVTAPA